MTPSRKTLGCTPSAPLADPRQASLFPDYTGQTELPEGEPVLSLAGTRSESADEHIQADAPDNFGT